MLCTELSEPVVHCFEANSIELGFEAKMAEAALELEDFEFDIGQHGGEEVGGLRSQGFGGRLAHGSVLLERLVLSDSWHFSTLHRLW